MNAITHSQVDPVWPHISKNNTNNYKKNYS